MRPESTLNQLKIALPNGELPSSYGVYFKNTLVALCHALEDHVLQRCTDLEAERPLLLVTFQQGKFYLQEADRYQELAHYSRHIVVAAIADSGFASHKTGQLENVSLVNLQPDDCVVQEWNLIIVAPGYTSMVLCHELSEEDYRADSTPKTDTERKFYGLWTFDRACVEQAAAIYIEHMRSYQPDLADRLLEMYHSIKANPNPIPIDLSGVVSRIVSYLQTSQEKLITVNRQTREFRELEGQAQRLSRNLSANKLQAFLRMAQRVDERDHANPLASLQVSALAETLGQILDLPTLQLRRLRLAGLLFRVGLAEAPTEVFTTLASKLNDASRAFWRERAVLGAQLLEAMPELAPIAHIVLHQREYWNGSGGPEGLREGEIPIESRILGLVVRFQELTQARSDRPALSLSTAFEKCEHHSGKRYDPDIVEALGTIVRLSDIGMMQLPQQPSQRPPVWLEETTTVEPAGLEVTS